MKEMPFVLQYVQVAAAMSGQETHFTADLYRLIAKADTKNLRRLRAAFPDEVASWERWFNGEHD